MKRTGTVLFITALFMLMNAGLALSQEANITTPPEAAPAAVEAGVLEVAAPVEADVQWVWGEVVSVDFQNKGLLVKYLDYETDQEKEVTITADDKTVYENIKAIDEIKAKDTVSIDYIVTAEGRNTAKSISLEKLEEPVVPAAESNLGDAAMPAESLQAAPEAQN